MVGFKSTLAGLKDFFMKPDVAGQVIAQLPKFGIGMVSTELGNKILNGSIGAFGNIINEKFNRGKYKDLLRALFTNMMVSVGDPTANQARELKRNWKDLIGGLKAHSYKTSFGALFEEPQEIVSALKGLLPNFKGFKSFKGFKGMISGKDTYLAGNRTIKAISPETVSVYSNAKLTERDIVTY